MKQERARLFLLLCSFSHPAKDFLAANLAAMCRSQGCLFDAYYAAGDTDVFAYTGRGHIHLGETGGLFSGFGSTVLGGRHHQIIARALAQFETTIVRLGEVNLFETLIRVGARKTITADTESTSGLVALLEQCAQALDIDLPTSAVVVQTRNLPGALAYGITQYAFPEALYRAALYLPVELLPGDIQKLAEQGVKSIWSVAAASTDLSEWIEAGFRPDVADTIRADDDYLSLTGRIAERWHAQVAGFDMTEPGMASFWLPYAVRENRLPVCAEHMTEAAAKIAALIGSEKSPVVYGRYAGGPICRANDDTDLFPLFERGLSYQVIEPRRPVLSVFSSDPTPLPQPAQSPFDLEPPDEQLAVWAERGFILTTLVFHSGELSHDDAVFNIMDMSALTQVRVGLPAHLQRYTFDPDVVEPMQVPVEEGGVLGLCEPMLHSTGYGILAESFANPEQVAQMMRQAREEIARVAGERFAPRGVYCYLDAKPPHWRERPEALWHAIEGAGFDYVISSVNPGTNELLYQHDDFVVLNISNPVYYPYSPFVRANSVAQLVDMERKLAASGRAGWLVTVLDTPIFAYTNYLLRGESRPMEAKPSLYGVEAAFGSFYKYIQSRGEMSKIISATPHTIARYVRLLRQMDLV